MKHKNSFDIRDICLFRYNNFIIFLSPKGCVIVDTKLKKPSFQYQISSNLLISKSAFPENKLESLINGLSTFHYKKLNLVGIGFRGWVYFDKSRNCQILSIKLGFSRDVLIFIPSNIIILCLRSTLILIKGIDKEEVSQIARYIKLIKVPDSYKGKGVRYENEIIFIKPGKQK